MSTYRILIVDDSMRSRSVLVEGLKAIGHPVVGEASDVKTGLLLVQNLRPDVIFLAVGLPDTDGITAARQIMEENPTPIVILSRHRDEDAIRRATEAGVMTYLIKPLRHEELRPAIELAVGRFREFMTLRKENANLKRALEERKVIERAKGLLMERERITEQEAFDRIRKASMKSRKPMVDLARALLTADELSSGNSDGQKR